MLARESFDDLHLWHNGRTVPAGCSKRPSSKAAASEEARRYVPHFVWPFTPRMDLGERINPASVSDLRKVLFNVEPLSDARTKLADFFSILLVWHLLVI
jgi:hypothetical protein